MINVEQLLINSTARFGRLYLFILSYELDGRKNRKDLYSLMLRNNIDFVADNRKDILCMSDRYLIFLISLIGNENLLLIYDLFTEEEKIIFFNRIKNKSSIISIFIDYYGITNDVHILSKYPLNALKNIDRYFPFFFNKIIFEDTYSYRNKTNVNLESLKFIIDRKFKYSKVVKYTTILKILKCVKEVKGASDIIKEVCIEHGLETKYKKALLNDL